MIGLLQICSIFCLKICIIKHKETYGTFFPINDEAYQPNLLEIPALWEILKQESWEFMASGTIE